MSSALDQFERSLVAASRELHAREQNAPTRTNPASNEGRPDRARRRTGAWRRRRSLLAFLGVLVVAGGVAAADSLLSPSERLADGMVNCFLTSSGTTRTALELKTPVFGVLNSAAEPPISLCRAGYIANDDHVNWPSKTGAKIAELPLVACQQNSTTVSVYIATGQPDECQRIGEKPLPATYSQAELALRHLQHALLTLQDEHDCSTPTALAAAARGVLAREGFTGWRVIMGPHDPGTSGWLYGYPIPAGTGGSCGKWMDLNTAQQTVTVSVGPAQSITVELNHISYELYTITYRHCFTATSVRALVRRWFANTPLRPRFATANTSDGGHYETQSQRLYDQGCVRFDSAIPGSNERFVDVLLNARDAARLPARQFYPPARAFKP